LLQNDNLRLTSIIEKLKRQGQTGNKILAVDDEQNILELVKLYLEREGYQVDTASCGSEALAKFPRFSPDFVVLDLMLPDMDGFEICRQIRTRNNPSSC
jgi:DNA-binding response OmpR family regulator